MHLSSAVRGDQTLMSIWAPLWRQRPVGLLPCASNPAAMWHAFPEYELEFAELDGKADLPTHSAPTAQRWERWRLGHFWHCQRCHQYSEAQLGHPPPLARLLRAMEPGWLDPGGWVTDPFCYQRLMCHHVRCGFEPRQARTAKPLAVRIPNMRLVYEEWDGMLRYLRSLEALEHATLSPPSFKPPSESSSLLPVVRSSARRLFDLDGTPYKVRPCLNLKPNVNERFLRWRFRFSGVDTAVRLILEDAEFDWAAGDDGLLWLSVMDLTKYYLYLGLGPVTSALCAFSDPRYEPTWPLKGEPPATWTAGRKAAGRTGRWRRFVCCPFGLAPMVAYSSALSGEMSQMLLAHGVANNYFVDDDLLVVRGRRRSMAAKQLAVKLGEWLGFKFSPKSEGPARCLKYLGLMLDLDRRELRCTELQRSELQTQLTELRAEKQITLGALRRLCGRMVWMGSVMTGGGTFTRNLFALMPGHDDDGDVLDLDDAALRHVDWWLRRLADPSWRGSAIILSRHQHPVTTFKSDASGDKMWGYVYMGTLHWCQPDVSRLAADHIQYKELLPVVHAALLYGHEWANRVVRVGVDNLADCYAINKQRSPDDALQAMLELLAECAREHNFLLVASHVDRRYNWLADMCTRFQVREEFSALLPAGVEVPSEKAASAVTCRIRCPGTQSQVFSLRLQLSARTV